MRTEEREGTMKGSGGSRGLYWVHGSFPKALVYLASGLYFEGRSFKCQMWYPNRRHWTCPSATATPAWLPPKCQRERRDLPLSCGPAEPLNSVETYPKHAT